MPMRLKGTIGAKIFGAFAAMSVITGLLGAYGLHTLSAAGDFVVDIYDQPFMAINYIRAAGLDFEQMDKELVRLAHAPDSERAGIEKRLSRLTTTFFEDIGVAADRSRWADERQVIDQIKHLVTEWNESRPAAGQGGTTAPADAIAKSVVEHFDLLAELTADHGFVARRQAISGITRFKYTSAIAIVVAVLLSAGITLLLVRRIVRPLSAAAEVADRIASGELETPVPKAGNDETGVLLRSISVMQDNIRVMVEREKAQRHSAQMRLIDGLEHSREAMVLIDPNGRLAVANSRLYSFFPPLKALDPESDFLAAFSDAAASLVTSVSTAEDRHSADAKSAWNEVVAGGGEVQLADGRWLRISRSGTQEGGFLLVLSDFTEIKEREERLREAKQLAEAASTAKSNFLANMSHELRTPLNAIIGFSEILSGEIFGKLGNAQYAEYAGSILASGRHLLDVINGVLDLAKSQAGKLQLNADAIDLRGIIDHCIATMREQCAGAKVQLIVKPVETPLPLWGDEPKLRQIILNLLSNAVKFTEPGGSVLLQARLSRDDRIEIEISDTGIGMSPDDIPTALAPFGQVDSRLARRYEGTGLGLPLTKALVELHHGVMTIDSAIGKGTTVTLSFARSTMEHPPLRLVAELPGELPRMAR
jgi:signal transduction histidine kinase/HAMP domain-containing protein